MELIFYLNIYMCKGIFLRSEKNREKDEEKVLILCVITFSVGKVWTWETLETSNHVFALNVLE